VKKMVNVSVCGCGRWWLMWVCAHVREEQHQPRAVAV
jgi:hypothetical protein